MKKYTSYIIEAVIGFSALAIFLFVSKMVYRIGFPLDDAWIHQTYARSLAQNGSWFYTPGIESAGSTSPLYTILLSIGYLFSGKDIPYFWTYFLGGAGLLWIGWMGRKYIRTIRISDRRFELLCFIFLVFEWHLVWAAGSGMETILFSALILTTITLSEMDTPSYWVIGLLAGILLWVRPDGITVMGPIAWTLLFSQISVKQKVSRMSKILLGALVPICGYFLFHQILYGRWFPNTLSAKQAEYISMTGLPLINRLISLYSTPLIGIGLILIPGLIAFMYNRIRQHRWKSLGGILWAIGYVLIFVLRLPVTYQHGRYLIPVIPIFVILGIIGISELIQMIKNIRRRNLVRVGVLAMLICVSAGFYFIGAKAYATDVAIIETEMVNTAQWANQHLESDAVVAIHDIGAFGFFANRKIIDLAGLISPEIIPIIRNEKELKIYLDAADANYLYTFPGWYEDLPDGKAIIYQSEGKISPQNGGENMTIYRWK